MRLHTIRLRGLGPYVDEVELDLDAIGGDLVAVVGDPGEGKSTLLEVWPGALHPRRRTPTRGSFDALADGHGKDAFVEVAFTCGEKHLRIRHDVGRERAHVYVDSEPAKLDGKVSRFGDWAEANLLPPEVVNACLFLSQKSEGLVDAEPGPRREALLRAIGIGEIEARAKQARSGAGEASAALAALRDKIDAGRRIAGTIPGLEARHRGAVDALAVAEARRAELAQGVEAARAARAAYEERERERRAALDAGAALVVEVEKAHARRGELEARAVAARAIVADADAIRAAAARVREIAASLPALRGARAAAEGEIVAGADAAAADDRAAADARRRWKDADNRRHRAESRVAARAAVVAAVAALDGLRAVQAREEEAIAGAAARAAALRAAAAATAETRIGAARTALGTVEGARRLADAKDTARAALAADDAAAAGVDPGAILAAETEATEARTRLAAAVEAVVAAERTAARGADLGGADEELEEALRARDEAEAAGKAAVARADAARSASEAAVARAGDLAVEIAGLEAEAGRLATAEAREAEIAGADARLVEIETQIAGLDAEIARIEAARAALPPIPDALPAPDVRRDQAALDAVVADLAHLGSAVGLAEQALTSARAGAEQLAVDEAALPAAEERLADWSLLAESLGISGVQALEIDAAGPALTTGMNDLLHASYGPRFTAEVNASRASKDGKKRIDECEILVADARNGRKGDVRTYSGGERVHLSTAFFLALASYVCRSRGFTAPTIVLDEPGGALGESLVGPWVDMVRDAARRIGADKVLVITHNPLVVDAADAVVRVRDGGVVVER